MITEAEKGESLPILLVISLSLFRTPNFNGDSSFSYLEKQMNFGYRIPDSPAHKKCENYIINRLRKTADTVYLQNFEINGVHFHNIIAEIRSKGKKWLLLGAHYDTRPFCDKDPDTTYQDSALPGANDGASGVAILLELARILYKKRPHVNIKFIFFDGEDFGKTEYASFIGSRYFVSTLIKKPDFAIIVDMVGDRDLNIYKEGFSERFSKEFNDRAFKIFKRLYPKNFIDSVKYYIDDDHIPLIKKGVSAIDIIDFDYPFWHTHLDTEDKCDPKSLEITGRAIEQLTYELR